MKRASLNHLRINQNSVRYLGGTQNRHEDGQQFAHDRQKLVFSEIGSDKLSEHLHSAMGGIG